MPEIGYTLSKDVWQCAACLRLLPVAQFRPSNTHTLGHSHWCLECWPAGRHKSDGKHTLVRPAAGVRTAKPCVVCRRFQLLEDFPLDKGGYDKRSSWCKACQRARALKQRTEKPLHTWSSKLKSDWGLTGDDYTKWLAEQDGKCAICRAPSELQSKRLAVDHDHVTGQLRGLLCINCNQLLGKAHDDVTILKAAIAYLEFHKKSVKGVA